MGLPSGFEMIGGVEAVAPILESISLDKASIDTTQNPQAITYSVAASDESGIDWSISVSKPLKVFAPVLSRFQERIRLMSRMLAEPSIR